ncbi:MAG: hypothetical protein WBA93_00830 [Microcoleaceae cyanobacterium]
MSKHSTLQENQSYTFSYYFDLPYDTEDILAQPRGGLRPYFFVS